MQNLLFINAFFEEELIASTPHSVDHWIQKHPLYLQLHYLSCLIADSTQEQVPLLVYPPLKDYCYSLEKIHLPLPSYHLFSSPLPPGCTLSSWGASPALASFAEQRHCLYSTPSLDVVKAVHSKAFAVSLAPRMPGATLIENEKELQRWWNAHPGPKVLKTLYGSSGRGHFLSLYEGEESKQKALSFFRKHSPLSSAFLAEPWVCRLLDFSTQWEIHRNGSYTYLGATLCENTPNGTYRKSIVGVDELLFAHFFSFLQEHRTYAEKALQKMAALSFFGHVGFDAMLYRTATSQTINLLPIVEVNARKTMGWAALKIKEKFPSIPFLSLSYENNAPPDSFELLPSCIELSSSHKLSFSKQLFLSFPKNRKDITE